jgi:PEP-CTERM motif
MSRPFTALAVVATLSLSASVSRADLIPWTLQFEGPSSITFGHNASASQGTVAFHYPQGQHFAGRQLLRISTRSLGGTYDEPLDVPRAKWIPADFTLGLTLRDDRSQETHSFLLSAVAHGRVRPDGTAYLESIDFTWPYSHRVVLGQSLYEVWAPGGSDGFYVGINPDVTPPPVTPEPSTLALGGTAALGLAASHWLRRRRGRSARG